MSIGDGGAATSPNVERIFGQGVTSMWETVLGAVVGRVLLEIAKWTYRRRSQWLLWFRDKWREVHPVRQELQTNEDSARFSVHVLEILTREREGLFQRRRRRQHLRHQLFRAAQGATHLHALVPQLNAWKESLLDVRSDGMHVNWNVCISSGEPVLLARLAWTRTTEVSTRQLSMGYVEVEVIRSATYAVFKASPFESLRPKLSTPSDPPQIAYLPHTHISTWKPPSVVLKIRLDYFSTAGWKYSRHQPGQGIPNDPSEYFHGDPDLRYVVHQTISQSPWNCLREGVYQCSGTKFSDVSPVMQDLLFEACDEVQKALSVYIPQQRARVVSECIVNYKLEQDVAKQDSGNGCP